MTLMATKVCLHIHICIYRHLYKSLLSQSSRIQAHSAGFWFHSTGIQRIPVESGGIRRNGCIPAGICGTSKSTGPHLADGRQAVYDEVIDQLKKPALKPEIMFQLLGKTVDILGGHGANSKLSPSIEVCPLVAKGVLGFKKNTQGCNFFEALVGSTYLPM